MEKGVPHMTTVVHDWDDEFESFENIADLVYGQL